MSAILEPRVLARLATTAFAAGGFRRERRRTARGHGPRGDGGEHPDRDRQGSGTAHAAGAAPPASPYGSPPEHAHEPGEVLTARSAAVAHPRLRESGPAGDVQGAARGAQLRRFNRRGVSGGQPSGSGRCAPARQVEPGRPSGDAGAPGHCSTAPTRRTSQRSTRADAFDSMAGESWRPSRSSRRPFWTRPRSRARQRSSTRSAAHRSLPAGNGRRGRSFSPASSNSS